jgi:hypothetical protein
MLLPSALDLDVAPALRSLRDEGWARVGNVVASGALAALRERADDLMLGRVVRPGLFFQIDAATGRYDDLTYGKGWQGPSTDYRKLEKLERDPLFLAFLENALFRRIARGWIDGPVALYRAVLFNKSASGGTELPWHQDGGRFWGVDRAPTLQIWTALDDAPLAAGCLEIIPRTHLAGLVTPEGGVVAEPLAAARAAEVVSVPAAAGDVVLIHNHVWHRSRRNHTGLPRRALTACLMPAATRCLRKRRAPREFYALFA